MVECFNHLSDINLENRTVREGLIMEIFLYKVFQPKGEIKVLCFLLKSE